MKTQVKIPSAEDSNVFPLIAVSRCNGITVLFSSPCCGTVLDDAGGTNTQFKVGLYADNWVNVFQTGDCGWVIAPKGSTVTLTQ